MPSRSSPKARNATSVTRASFSIGEFCARHAFSRRTFHNIRNAGRGPKEIVVSARMPRITAQAEQDWLEQLARTSVPVPAPVPALTLPGRRKRKQPPQRGKRR